MTAPPRIPPPRVDVDPSRPMEVKVTGPIVKRMRLEIEAEGLDPVVLDLSRENAIDMSAMLLPGEADLRWTARIPPPQSEAATPQRDDADRSATLAKTEPLSAEARSNLRRLAEAATPGPWTDETTCVGSAGHGPVAFFGAFADTAFIAAAREAVLALLEENKALRSEVDRLRAEREPNCIAHGSYGRQDFDPDCPRCRAAAALRGTP